MIVAKEEVTISLKLQKRELELFDEAVKKVGRFGSRSDAIRYLIRRFIDEQGLSAGQPVEHAHGRDKKETVAKEA